MSTQVCKFGAQCHRQDCFFQHPSGRVIDGTSMPPRAVGYVNTSTQQQSYTPQSTQPRTSGAVSACKFGRACHRPDCYFAHPNGRDVDEQQSNDNDDAEQQEIFRAIDQQNGQLNESDFACPCCNGNSRSCKTAECRARGGICGCEFGNHDDMKQEYADAEVEAADSWRDEWFPTSRQCECCQGYIYKCQHQSEDCDSQCYCAAQNAVAAH